MKFQLGKIQLSNSYERGLNQSEKPPSTPPRTKNQNKMGKFREGRA